MHLRPPGGRVQHTVYTYCAVHVLRVGPAASKSRRFCLLFNTVTTDSETSPFVLVWQMGFHTVTTTSSARLKNTITVVKKC